MSTMTGVGKKLAALFTRTINPVQATAAVISLASKAIRWLKAPFEKPLK